MQDAADVQDIQQSLLPFTCNSWTRQEMIENLWNWGSVQMTTINDTYCKLLFQKALGLQVISSTG